MLWCFGVEVTNAYEYAIDRLDEMEIDGRELEICCAHSVEGSNSLAVAFNKCLLFNESFFNVGLFYGSNLADNELKITAGGG